MPPKPRRPENRGLPKRWRYQHSAYYYLVPPGLEHLWDGKKSFRLGKNLAESYRVWAERMEHPDKPRTIGQLLDRYALQVLPAKAPKTQREQSRIIKRLAGVFGALPLAAIKPKHVYQYIDKRGAKTAALREMEVLRHAYTKAVEWGLLDRHPLQGQVNLRGLRPKPRSRYVEDWEILEVLSLTSRRKRGSVHMVQAYIRLKLLTGLRRGDLLQLREADLKKDGIHILPSKTATTTGRRIIIEWTDALRDAVSLVREARPLDISPLLFCAAKGRPYVRDDGSTNAWDSLWQRFMARVLAETRVSERFTEHDLRAKAGSDADTVEHAQQLLTHADARTTERHYRRKPRRVQPLK